MIFLVISETSTNSIHCSNVDYLENPVKEDKVESEDACKDEEADEYSHKVEEDRVVMEEAQWLLLNDFSRGIPFTTVG